MGADEDSDAEPGNRPVAAKQDSPELLEDVTGGNLAEALRRRGGRSRGDVGAAASFSVLQYPLLRLGDADDAQTKSEATLNLLNNLLGAGILAMPRAMASAGVLGGLLVMALVALANRYTLHLVLWMSETVLQETSYPEIGRHFFGSSGVLAVLLAYLLFTGGILTAYLIAIVDILLQIPFLTALPRALLVCMAVLICGPGSMLRSLRHVAILSGVCMAAVCTLVLSVATACLFDLLLAEKEGQVGKVVLFRWDLSGLLRAISLFALQFSVQAGGIEVLSRIAADPAGAGVDGHEVSSIPAAEAVSKLAFSVAVALSGVIGLAAYLRFGDEVEGDVLLSFASGPHSPRGLLMIARLSFGFVVTCSFAFIVVPCRSAVADLLSLRRRGDNGDGDSMLGPERHRNVTGCILGIIAAVAWVVPDLALMLEFVGVWATMALAFVLPCAFLIELRRRQDDLPYLSADNALPLLLVACGVAVALFSSAGYLAPLFRSSQ